jgi:uncharacterized membrane protein
MHRHRDVSRLEGFSDAVFGFALTLLVVSLEVPETMDALRTQMRGFVPFALMFTIVCWIWYEHNIFFRRYGLEDAWTVFLNSVLLFTVLFYVYPLKFLTTKLVASFTGGGGEPLLAMDGAYVMLLYSGGVVLIFAVFTLLHRHAWNRREALGLSAAERLTLAYSTRAHVLSAGVGLVSIAIALAFPRHSQFAGWIYGLMGPLHGVNGHLAGRAHADLAAREAGTTRPAGQAT